MKNKQQTIEQYVDSFLSKQGITQPLKQEIYWRKLSARFGKVAEEFGDRIQRRELGERIDPYSLKNSSLEFSDAVTSQSDSPRLRKFFCWFLKQGFDLEGKTLLDFGCDSGLFACFVAQTFPSANVVGFDQCAEAISVASQRAEQSQLENVTFITGTLNDLTAHSGHRTYDVITSMVVFHELLADGFIGDGTSAMQVDVQGFSVASTDHHNLASQDCPELFQIAHLLDADGAFISIDRWGHASQLLRWVRFCENAGFKIIPASSFMLSYLDATKQTETMPISVFKKRTDEDLPARSSDMLALFCYPDFLKIKGLHPVENQNVAELIFESLQKENLYIEEATYRNGSGVMRTYVGTAGGVGYVFRTTSLGYRELHLLPSIALSEHLEELKIKRLALQKVAQVSYEVFNEAIQKSLGLNFQ